MSTYGVKLQRSDDLKLLRHPAACDAQEFKQWCARQSRLRPLAVDLFSGAGGLSLGLEDAGWTVAAAVDHDPKALATHRANFAGLALDVDLGDDRARRALIRELRGIDIDLVAGGPPCQPFSRAGRSKIRSLVDAGVRDEHDHRKELWRAFVDVVLKIKPRAVLMENVPDMALGDELCVVRTIVDMLERAGYRTQVRLVDAWRYGVPQHRQRLILLARLDGGDFTWRDEAPVHTNLRHAIGDLPPLGLGTGSREMPYVNADSDYAREMRRGAPEGIVHDHMTRPVRDDDRQVFALMNSKTLYSQIDESLRRYSADTFDDKYKRLDWADLSRSITAHIAKDGYWYIHPEEHRTLTVREAARVQTFPDRFRFAGTRSDAFRQIGNAVPPRLGAAAAEALVPHQLPMPAVERDWRRLRRNLATWATRQLRSENWYLFPSAQMTPILAAIVSITRGQSGLDAALDTLPTYGPIKASHLAAVREHWAATPALRKAVDRVEKVLPGIADTTDPDQVAEKVKLLSSEAELYRVLLGADRLIPNPTSVRVAARVLGTMSHEANVRTDGRLDLALLVGSGPHAPARMAAIRLLGSTVCRPRQDRDTCRTCPLVDVCDWQVATAVPPRPSQATRTRSAAAVTS